MFSRDALRALEKDNQSEFELSSDDEDVGNNNNVPFARHVRLGADVVTQNQREYTPLDPPDEQEDESEDEERSAFNYESEPEAPREPDIVEGEEEQVTPNAELFDYLTPKPNIKWRHRQINNTIPTDFLLPIALEPIVQDPICYYNRYVPVELFEQMAEMTNLYAVQSGKTRFKPTSSYEIEILFGLHMATGVFNYPVLKMYWENHISIPLFTNNMARDRFFELRNNLHLVDNMKKPTNCTDVFYKVRPIYNAIRSRCLEIPLEKELCVDEQIVPFTGKHSAKQYIKGKPCPWGMKLFFLCGKNGRAYDFIIYQNSIPELDRSLIKKVGFGAAVVLHLMKRVGDSRGHELYCDNYFSSYYMLQILKHKGIMATCTARVNRFTRPPLLSDKDIKKKPRGFAEEICSTDGDVTMVKWLDNKPANLASNFVGIGEKDMVKRWSKTEKRFIEVERPEIVKKYNHAMGGVDLLDQLMSYYRTFIKSKKWPLRMIFHASDLAVVQAYREYDMDCDLLGIPKAKRLALLHFRRRLAESLVLRNKISGAKRGRPSSLSSPLPVVVPRRPGEVRPSTEIARDGIGHFPAHDDGCGTRCKLTGCKGKSRIKCIKCKVHLCLTKDKNCFLSFHT